MKKITLILVLFSVITFAQTNRFVYEYKYVPNIHEKDTIRKEMMLLDINSKGSRYYSHEKFVQDSIMKADFDRQIALGSNDIKLNQRSSLGRISYQVTKNYPDYKTALLTQIGEDKYNVVENEELHWKILPETKKIGEYDTQKATASFGGREWVAWFSKDIPFQDGLYKFHGLPGLIVKVEDTTGSHVITLFGNRKVEGGSFDTEIKNPGVPGNPFSARTVEVDEKKFKKIWNDYLNDPSKNMREMMMKNSAEHKVVIKMKTPDGREITDMNEIYRNMEKRVKEAESKNNNKIEPSLYSN